MNRLFPELGRSSGVRPMKCDAVPPDPVATATYCWPSTAKLIGKIEARQPVGIGRERLGQHFERHVPVELRVAGAVDLTHAALADQADDFVRADGRSGV